MREGKESHRRGRSHEAGHADIVNILRGDTRIFEQRFQSQMRESPFIFSPGIALLIGSEEYGFPITECYTGIKKIFIYTKPERHRVSIHDRDDLAGLVPG
jgi:hypothetical protein